VVLPTLLTIPLGGLWGPIAGYISMIILMVSAAAAVYYCFIRHTFLLPAKSAFVAGAFFGFSPFFVFKTHAHPNLIGGAFWGGCIAVVVHAYVHDKFGRRRGLLFGLCLWATFWTSFVEFFELLIVIAAVVIAFELYAAFRRTHHSPGERIAFFAMSLPGLASLAAFANAPSAGAVDIAPFANIRLSDLIIPPRLSYFGNAFKVSEYEYWGSHLPLVFVILFIVGLLCTRRYQLLRSSLFPIVVLAVLTAIIIINPHNVPLDVIRRVPLGNGFRVAARFLPFFYFFLLIPAAFGIDHLIRVRRAWWAGSILVSLSVLAAVELYPAKLRPSAVKMFEVPNDVARDGARGVFTLIIPRGVYTNVLDTYQISMNVPIVHLSYLAREDPKSSAIRRKRFPKLYPNPTKLSGRVLSQMRDAGVRYVLFEDRAQYDAGHYRGQLIAEHGGAVLVRDIELH
jgi:hypothetical protein